MTEQKQEPTPAEQQAAAAQMGNEIAQAAAGAETPEQAREDAAKAARRAADRGGLEISDEQIKQLANAVVDAMDARGAFDTPIEAVQPPPPAAPAPVGEDPVAPAAPVAPVADTSPKKKSFAQRFLGE